VKPLDLIEIVVTHALDGLFAGIPRFLPTVEDLQTCRIISHRGEHDNQTVFENTLPAFDAALTHGVWGIECDVRWTKDLIPVVFHDADLLRLFHSAAVVGQTEFGQLRQNFPQIPTLNEVLTRYGRSMHLMVEIKTEFYPDPVYQGRILSEEFGRLIPEKDYHFLSLNPDMFQFVDFAPPGTCVTVAQLNVAAMSQLALKENYGGMACHYAFMSRARMQTHQQRNQKVGTAYIRSRNSLFREINRGVDWLFSNHAVKVQPILNNAIEKRKTVS
jgi:glycerophosphoryl diester phosphodiesterase